MAHEVFALIHNELVVNIVVGTYTNCDNAAKDTYGENAFAVDVTRYPVQIGDFYRYGRFERETDIGTVTIDPVPTEADQIAALISANQDIRAELDAVSLSVLDIVGGV